MAPLISYLPSPGSNGIQLGPLNLRMYGVMIALGVVAGVWLARRRWAGRGGDPEDITTIAIWAVPAGLIGARLYHVITDNELYRGHWIDAVRIWDGGLGIPGGIAVGVAVGVAVGRHKRMSLPVGLDAVAPAMPLAQAIGRWGNWWNQELFGRPTDLPWGLSIDPAHRPPAYRDAVAFQPTFLYESLWNLALCGGLILLDRRRVVRPGRLFVLYIAGYFLGRLWVESLRSDTANEILGLRVNTWVSLAAIAASVLFLAVFGFRRRPTDSDDPYDDGRRFDPGTGEMIPVPAATPSAGSSAAGGDGEAGGDEGDDGAGDEEGDDGAGGEARAPAAPVATDDD
jgi:prolipoprotein diacylglyceryl transferase